MFYLANLNLESRRIGLDYRGQPLRGDFENSETRSKNTVGPEGLTLGPHEV